MTIEQLNHRFACPHVTFRTGLGGLPTLRVDHPAASAEIYLHGAHLTHYQPAQEHPVLFVSPRSKFEPGAPIRGGVPICFPWFGPRSGDPTAPAHGFARISTWTVADVNTSDHGVKVIMTLESSDSTRALWDANFLASIEFDIGRTLRMTFRVTNRGTDANRFEEALHTYFAVSDVRLITVEGLQGREYIDKTDQLALKTDTDRCIALSTETDRLYFDTADTCLIDDNDRMRERGIRIEKSGSKTTVVWNPFPGRAEQLKDIGVDNWKGFVCVETANAGPNAITLAPGETHEMVAVISLVHRVMERVV